MNSRIQRKLNKNKKSKNMKRLLLVLSLVAVIVTSTVLANPASALAEDVSDEVVQGLENGGDSGSGAQAPVEAADEQANAQGNGAAPSSDPQETLAAPSADQGVMNANSVSAVDSAAVTENGTGDSGIAAFGAEADGTEKSADQISAAEGSGTAEQDATLAEAAETMSTEEAAAEKTTEQAAQSETDVLSFADDRAQVKIARKDGSGFPSDTTMSGSPLGTDDWNRVLSAVSSKVKAQSDDSTAYSVAGLHTWTLSLQAGDGSAASYDDIRAEAEFQGGLNDAGYATKTSEKEENGTDGTSITTASYETSWRVYAISGDSIADPVEDHLTDLTDADGTSLSVDENGALQSAAFDGSLPETVVFAQIVRETVTTGTEKKKEIPMPAVNFDKEVATDHGTIIVHVEADEGTFEQGTTMSVKQVSSQDILDKAIEAAGGRGSAAAVDISFRKADGTETEPAKPIRVKMTAKVLSQADKVHVVHVDDTGSTDVVARKSDGKTIESTSSEAASSDAKNAVSFESDSFSVYAIVYTVDFEYSVNGKKYQFSLHGGKKITLSDLVEVLGIIDDTNNGEKAAFNSVDSFLKEVANVEFSDENLVKVTPVAGDWELESLQPFTSEETLTVTMKNGDQFVVKVTDTQESSNLGDFLTKVTVSGASVVDGHYVVEQGKTYNATMYFKETANLQFDNEGNLTYKLPKGVTLPKVTTTTIKISVVSGGKTYEIPATVTANGTTVTVKFDETDQNYNKLAQLTNAGFRVSVGAQFTESISKTQWGAEMDKDIILDTTDHSDAFAEKSGYFDESTGIFHYTVKVKANGDVTNVNVKDIISGNALDFNNDVYVSGNSSDFKNKGLSAGQKGFDYTFPSMKDGEEIVITYSASLDQTVAKSSDKITADQTKNTVTVQKEGGEPHSAVYSQEINMKSPQKSDGTIAGVTENGDKLYNWSIDYNPLALVSAAGDKIKDSISASSQEYMKYYGDVIVKVYDHSGKPVDTRRFTPGSDSSSWEYTIPAGDTTPYHYVFEYQTIVDETKVAEGGAGIELKNEVEGKGGKDSGKIDVGPKDKTTIEKSVESFNRQEITWSAVVHVGEDGLNKAEVIDTLPKQKLQDYNWELVNDQFKEDSLTVEGRVDGEHYTVDTSDPGQVKIIFTKDDGKPGLKAVPGGHDIKIKLTTEVDKRWLHEAELHGGYWQTHTNTISINGTTDTASVDIGASGVEKRVSKTTVTVGGEQKTAFEYNIVLKNVYDDSIVVSDTFDKDLLYLLEDPGYNKDSTNDINLHIYGGDQYNQNDPRGGALINYSESENGVIFSSNSLPKDANGNPYSYYRICYFLVLKDGVNLETLAVENGGKYSIINNAKWGDLEGTATYEHKYDFLNKELLKEATSTDRHVQYRITYNLAKGMLNGGKDIQMTDRLNKNLSIDYTSIQIKTDPAGVNVPYSLSGDGAETVATYTIPDSTAVTITYDAMVVGNGSVNYKNTVEANGETETVEKTTNINIEGEGSAAVADLKITKVDGYDANKKLAGVKFKLYAADGRSLSLNKNEDLKEVILVTDENGVLHIDGSKYQIFLGATADKSVKYYLEEVAPPDGYGTISSPYEFTLVDDINGVNYENHTYFFNDSFQIKNWPLEGLVVGKNVESDEEADHTKEFTFEVSILKEDGEVDTSVNQQYGDMTFRDGVAKFTLKDKEQASAWSGVLPVKWTLKNNNDVISWICSS